LINAYRCRPLPVTSEVNGIGLVAPNAFDAWLYCIVGESSAVELV
jgi:hypothetical protein